MDVLPPYQRDENATVRHRLTRTADSSEENNMVPFCDTKQLPNSQLLTEKFSDNIPLLPINGQLGERGEPDGSNGSSREQDIGIGADFREVFGVGSGADEDGEDSTVELFEENVPLLAEDEEEIKVELPVVEDESSWTIFLQVVFPFLIAGVGMVGAGLVLDVVQHWRVFTQVPEIFILVPALLGLKGNLEMTLASRLSTLANLGRMDCKKEQAKQITSNLALIQAQATVVAFLASLFAITLAWIPKGKVDWNHALLLSASSLTTASLASLLLGIIMVGVVLLSRKYKINPDNVATPIAASLGDLTTLAVLSCFGFFVLLAPLWMWVASQNPGTFEVLKHGWSPVIFAMLISSGGGFILRFAVTRFGGIAVFQPVINGVGGNLVAVQASRISTSLHKSGPLGKLPAGSPHCCANPFKAFCGIDVTARASRVLMFMVIPGHLIFMYIIQFLQAGHTSITLMFSVVYLTAAFIQVACLLHVCVGMVQRMWECGVDPDNSAIPYLTALGDLLGTGLLALAFLLLYYLGDRDSDVGEK